MSRKTVESQDSSWANLDFTQPDVPNLAVESIVKAPQAPTLNLHQLAPQAALRRLELAVVRRLDGYLHGDHLGLLPGHGSELSDARAYIPGEDDVRTIDWAVTARTGEPHVRKTIADRELEIWAMLDATPSMNWGTAGVTKRDLGIAAIATIGFLSQKMGDRFGGMILTPEKLDPIPARSGRDALYGLLRRMLLSPIASDQAKTKIDLPQAIEQLNRTQPKRGLRIVVSDFLTPGDLELDENAPTPWENALRRLAARNQVLCVEVRDAGEFEMPSLGEILIKDPESNYLRYVNTSDEKLKTQLAAAAQAQHRRIACAMRRCGVGHLQLRTDQDWVNQIARFVLSYRRTAAIIHKPPMGVSK